MSRQSCPKVHFGQTQAWEHLPAGAQAEIKLADGRKLRVVAVSYAEHQRVAREQRAMPLDFERCAAGESDDDEGERDESPAPDVVVDASDFDDFDPGHLVGADHRI